MSDVNWDAVAVVHSRSDGGSELDFNFDKLAEGPLSDMVKLVAAMPSAERARVIFDISGRGNLDIGQVMALAARSDLPGAKGA
jgi:hypothetical protein